ncbi:succinate dehydrogenase, hydrophobic membrane anchor protein [Chitinolyticbacter albus]|uniref:succinate dehydrogenase, hydrophobic membrane anchor protein n=1 Tax=Chitinolyticbacter albus TaxID=2961951 RepID=UPI00210CD1B2|nr:succinate dehydrogenase, hydrophobic membrane anchor protein [Chitinolyticbacter albus]
MVNRQVVGAHYGLRDWLVQRVTAVIMLVYTIGIVAFLFLATDASYAAWQALFACTWVKVLTTVTVVALLWHAWVGVRDIWMDYVQPVGIRLTLHVLTILWLVASFIYSIHVVWGV